MEVMKRIFLISLVVNNSYCFTARVLRAKISPFLEEELVPEDNPYVDPKQKSISGVAYGDVLSAINELYPPKDLSKRNAVSRADGFWDYIEKGQAPPKHYTYGEYDLLFFSQLLDKAYEYHSGFDRDGTNTGWDGKTFIDIGSGAGRLVLAAGMLHPGLKLSMGIEILPSLHKLSLEKLDLCRVSNQDKCVVDLIKRNKTDPHVERITTTNAEEVVQELYVEPLNTEMSAIQKALESMSSEEWKELLGDDYDLFVHGICEEDQTEAFEFNDTHQHQQQEYTDETSDTSQIDIIRTTPFEIGNGFIIKGENDLFYSSQENDDSSNSDDKSVYFESIEDFLSIDMEKWTSLVGVEQRRDAKFRFTEDITDSTNITTTSESSEQEKYELNYHGGTLQMAPCKFVCNSFQDPYGFVGDADIIFVFSSCMSCTMIGELSECIGRCRPGTVVITTEFPLHTKGIIQPCEDGIGLPQGEYKITLMDTVTGFNWVTNQSTAYIHRVEKSTWDGIRRTKPKLKASDIAYTVIRKYESNLLTNTGDFMRQVRNDMKFHYILETIDEYLHMARQSAKESDDSISG